MKSLFVTLLAIATLTLFSSCREDYTAENEAEIQQYIADNNLNAISVGDGLYYTMDRVGTGATPNINSSITLNYRGYYTDGEQFDANTGSPVTFPLANLIEGWQRGLQYFKAGGKGKLLIPSHLGYGATPPAGIRPNAVLLFDIELISVQ